MYRINGCSRFHSSLPVVKIATGTQRNLFSYASTLLARPSAKEAPKVSKLNEGNQSTDVTGDISTTFIGNNKKPRKKKKVATNMPSLFLSEYRQTFSNVISQENSRYGLFRLALVGSIISPSEHKSSIIDTKSNGHDVSVSELLPIGHPQAYVILRKVYDCYLSMHSECNTDSNSVVCAGQGACDGIELSFMTTLVQLLSTIDLDKDGILNGVCTIDASDSEKARNVTQKVKKGKGTLVNGKHPSSKKSNYSMPAGDKYRYMTPADLYAALLINARAIEMSSVGFDTTDTASKEESKAIIHDLQTLKVLRLILAGWICDVVFSACCMDLSEPHQGSNVNTSRNIREEYFPSTEYAAKQIAECVKIIGSVSVEPMTGFSTEERDNIIKSFVDAFTRGTAHISGSKSRNDFNGKGNKGSGDKAKVHDSCTNATDHFIQDNNKFFAIVASKTVLGSLARYLLPTDEKAYLLSISAVLNGSGIKDISSETDSGDTHNKSIDRMHQLLSQLLNNGIPPGYLLKSPSASTMKSVRLIEYIRAISLFCSTNAAQLFQGLDVSGSSLRNEIQNTPVIGVLASGITSLPTGAKSQHSLFPKLGHEALSNILSHLVVQRIVGFATLTIHHLTPITDMQRKSLIAELILHGHPNEGAAVASTHLQMIMYSIRERKNTPKEQPLSTYFMEAGKTISDIHRYICDRFDEVKESLRRDASIPTDGPVHGLPVHVIASLETAQQQCRDGLLTVLSLYSNFINELSSKVSMRANDTVNSLNARIEMQDVYDKYESIVGDMLGVGVAAQISQICAGNLSSTMIAALQASSPSLKDETCNSNKVEDMETRMHLWVSQRMQGLGASVRRSIYGSTLVARCPMPVLLPPSDSFSVAMDLTSPLELQTSTKSFLQDMLVDGVIRPYVAYLAERVSSISSSSDEERGRKRINHEDSFFANNNSCNTKSNSQLSLTTNFVNTTSAMEKLNRSILSLTRDDVHDISRIIFVAPLQKTLEETGIQQNIFFNEHQRLLSLVLDVMVGLLTSFHRLLPTLDSGGERLEFTNFKGILRHAYIHQKVIEQQLLSLSSPKKLKNSKTDTQKQPKPQLDDTLHDMVLLADVTYIFPPSVQEDALTSSPVYYLYEQVVTGKLKKGLTFLRDLLDKENQQRGVSSISITSSSQSGILLRKIEEVFLNSASWLGRRTADDCSGSSSANDSSLDYCFNMYLRITLPFITFDISTPGNNSTTVKNKTETVLNSQRKRAIKALSFLSQLRQAVGTPVDGVKSQNIWLDPITNIILQHCGQGLWPSENNDMVTTAAASGANIHDTSNTEIVLLLEAACGSYCTMDTNYSRTIANIQTSEGRGNIPGPVQAMTVRIAKEMLKRSCSVSTSVDAGNTVGGNCPNASQMCTVMKCLSAVVRNCILESVALQLSARTTSEDGNNNVTRDISNEKAHNSVKKANVLVQLLEHVASVVVDRRLSLDAGEVAIAMDTIVQYIHGPLVSNDMMSGIYGYNRRHERLMMSLLNPFNSKLRQMQETYIRSFVSAVIHSRDALMPKDLVKCLRSLVIARVHHATCLGTIFQRVSDIKGLFDLPTTISIIEIAGLARRQATLDSRQHEWSVDDNEDDDFCDYTSGYSLSNQRHLPSFNSSTMPSVDNPHGMSRRPPSAVSTSKTFSDVGYGIQRSCLSGAHPILKQCVQSILDANIDLLLYCGSNQGNAALSRMRTNDDNVYANAVSGGKGILKALRLACPGDPVCDLALAVIATNVNRAHIEVVVEALKLALAKGGTDLRTIQLFKEYCIGTVLLGGDLRSTVPGIGYTVNEAVQLAHMVAVNGVRSDDLFFALERRVMQELDDNREYYSAAAALMTQTNPPLLPQTSITPLSSTGLATICRIYSSARRYNWGFLRRVLTDTLPAILLRSTSTDTHSCGVTASHITTFIGTTRYAIALSPMQPPISQETPQTKIHGEDPLSQKDTQKLRTDSAAQVMEFLLQYAISAPHILHGLKYDDIRDILEVLKCRIERVTPNRSNVNDNNREVSNINTHKHLPTQGSKDVIVAQVLLHEIVNRSGIVVTPVGVVPPTVIQINTKRKSKVISKGPEMQSSLIADHNPNTVPLWKLCDEKIRDLGYSDTNIDNSSSPHAPSTSLSSDSSFDDRSLIPNKSIKSSPVQPRLMERSYNTNTTSVPLPDPPTCASIVSLLLDLRVLCSLCEETANININTVPAAFLSSFSDTVAVATTPSTVKANLTLLFSYMFFTRKSILSRQLFFNRLHSSFDAHDEMLKAFTIGNNEIMGKSLEDIELCKASKASRKGTKCSTKMDVNGSSIGITNGQRGATYNTPSPPSLQSIHPLFYEAVMDDDREDGDGDIM